MADGLKEALSNASNLAAYIIQTSLDERGLQDFVQFLDKNGLPCTRNPLPQPQNVIYVRPEDLATVRFYDREFGKRLASPEAGKWQDDAEALIDLVNSGVTL